MKRNISSCTGKTGPFQITMRIKRFRFTSTPTCDNSHCDYCHCSFCHCDYSHCDNSHTLIVTTPIDCDYSHYDYNHCSYSHCGYHFK